MDDSELKLIVEALLISSPTPLSCDKIQSVFDDWQKPTMAALNRVILQLVEDYKNRAIELHQVAGGYRIQTKVLYSKWIEKLATDKPGKYSRALLETLAIIAYKQPVTRGDIEDIRGVAVSSSIIKTLLEREWVRVAGHRDVPGKPAVYATTRLFLDYFNLQHLNQLPGVDNAMKVKEAALNRAESEAVVF